MSRKKVNKKDERKSEILQGEKNVSKIKNQNRVLPL